MANKDHTSSWEEYNDENYIFRSPISHPYLTYRKGVQRFWGTYKLPVEQLSARCFILGRSANRICGGFLP